MGNETDHIPVDFLQTLKIGEAMGKIDKTVFPLKTWLADQQSDQTRTKEVIERSRLNYGIKADTKSWFRKKPPINEVKGQVDKPNTPASDVTPVDNKKDNPSSPPTPGQIF